MNKYQEALDRIVKQANERKLSNQVVVSRWDYELLQQAIDKANKYDEKENPMKPNNFDKEYCMYNCPNCSKVNATFKFSYCPHCGQKLDWSEE